MLAIVDSLVKATRINLGDMALTVPTLIETADKEEREAAAEKKDLAAKVRGDELPESPALADKIVNTAEMILSAAGAEVTGDNIGAAAKFVANCVEASYATAHAKTLRSLGEKVPEDLKNHLNIIHENVKARLEEKYPKFDFSKVPTVATVEVKKDELSLSQQQINDIGNTFQFRSPIYAERAGVAAKHIPSFDSGRGQGLPSHE